MMLPLLGFRLPFRHTFGTHSRMLHGHFSHAMVMFLLASVYPSITLVIYRTANEVRTRSRPLSYSTTLEFELWGG